MKLVHIWPLALILSFVSCQKDKTFEEKGLTVQQESLTGEIYPHSASFLNGHGISYLNNKKSCTTCHGENLEGGTSKVSCTQCHSSYPHSPLFSMGKNHGAKFGKVITKLRAESDHPETFEYLTKNECTMCHNSNSSDSKEAAHKLSAKNVSCNSCHISFPHHYTHGSYGNSKALQSSCLNCHRESHGDKNARNLMPNFNNCSTCHDDYGNGTKPTVRFMTKDEAKQLRKCLYEIRNGKDCTLIPEDIRE